MSTNSGTPHTRAHNTFPLIALLLLTPVLGAGCSENDCGKCLEDQCWSCQESKDVAAAGFDMDDVRGLAEGTWQGDYDDSVFGHLAINLEVVFTSGPTASHIVAGADCEVPSNEAADCMGLTVPNSVRGDLQPSLWSLNSGELKVFGELACAQPAVTGGGNLRNGCPSFVLDKSADGADAGKGTVWLAFGPGGKLWANFAGGDGLVQIGQRTSE